MLSKIKDVLMCGGVGEENYAKIQKEINDENRRLVQVFSVIAFGLICVMYFVSFGASGFVSSQSIFVAGMITSLIICVMSETLAQKYPIFTKICIYGSMETYLLYGIFIGTISRKDEPTVTFMVMLVLMSLLFVDRPICISTMLLLNIVMYIVICLQTKPQEIMMVDIVDALIYGILGMASGVLVISNKIRGFVMAKELRIISETDALTQTNNRNCYEWRLDKYMNSFKESLCCIYIDVNGLHQLNNSQGHDAGDRMLQYVANKLKNAFGYANTYRIGGDEFVVFVVDRDMKYVKKKINMVSDEISNENYHIAIGYSYCTQKTNISAFIKEAETMMYESKNEYYRVNNITR